MLEKEKKKVIRTIILFSVLIKIFKLWIASFIEINGNFGIKFREFQIPELVLFENFKILFKK